jgi:DNA invertase Pin-like site-specific DNA recombinase
MDYTTINIHLGDDNQGARRKRALERLAAEAGYEWGGNPSVGRWLVGLADQKLEEDAVNIRELVERAIEEAGANAGVITDATGYPTAVTAIRPQFNEGRKNNYYIDVEQPFDDLVAEIKQWWERHLRLYHRS